MQALNSGHLECLRLALKTLSQGLVANSGKLSTAKPEAVVSDVPKPVEPAVAAPAPAIVTVDVSHLDESILATLRTASCQYFPRIAWQSLPTVELAEIAEPDAPALDSSASVLTVSGETFPDHLLKINADFFGKLPWTTRGAVQSKAEINAEVDEKPLSAISTTADQISGSAFFQGLAWNGQLKSEIKVQPPQTEILPLDAMSMGQLALQSAMKTAARPAPKADYFTLSSKHFFQTVFNPEKTPSKATQDQPENTIHLRKNNEFFPRLPW